MIIKSMSRRDPSFAQLVLYIDQGAGDHEFYLAHNFLSDPQDTETVIAQFEDNSQHLRERRGGLYMYHEIISLPPESSTQPQTDQQLADLVQQYIQQRCPDNLVYVRIHRDRHCPHAHLAISANPVRALHRHRLSKAQFRQIQADLEQYQLTYYPELGQQRHYQPGHQSKRASQSTAEYHYRQRTGQPSERERVATLVKDALTIATTTAELHQIVRRHQLQFYQHRNTFGVTDQRSGRKYRLKTLGLAEDYRELQQTLSEIERQRRELEQLRYQQAEIGRDYGREH